MLFSIVIANYNYGKYLSNAINSVLNQTCKDYELIIVDGGSTDNSLNIIKLYEKDLAWWVSEPDRGQSDAFNKGFSRAKGDFFLWLNSDDLLTPKALEHAKDSIEKNPSVKWFFGNTLYIDNNDHVCHVSRGCNFSNCLCRYGYIIPSGPTTFFHRSVFEKFGPFEVEYHYTMDGDLWRKFVNGGVNYKMINYFCWVFRLHEESKTSGVFLGGENPKVSSEENLQKKRNQIVSKSYIKIIQMLKRYITCYPIILFYKMKYKGVDISSVLSIIN